MNLHTTESAKLFSSWGLVLLIVSTAVGAEPAKGPPIPRIANVYGTALTADGGRFHGEDRTLEDVARYDLLIGEDKSQ